MTFPLHNFRGDSTMAQAARKTAKAKVLTRSLTLFVWGPVQTIIGYWVLYLLTSLTFGFLNWIFEVKYFGHNNLTQGGVLFLAISYFYLMAIAKVEETRAGLPTLLGARRGEFVLPEGYTLILPRPLMGYSEIPLQVITTELREPMEILVSNQPLPAQGGTQPPTPQPPNPNDPLPYQVRMKISQSIMWQPDPNSLLSYTQVEGGKSGVETALVELMRRVIRETAQHLSDTQALTGQEIFEEKLWDALHEPVRDDDLGRTFVEKLGIRVSKVQTTKIVPASEELAQRYERLRGEDLDRQAEKAQARHVIDNLAGPLKKELGVDGDVALYSALAMTGDAKLNVVSGTAGDFTKGQVAAQNGGK